MGETTYPVQHGELAEPRQIKQRQKYSPCNCAYMLHPTPAPSSHPVVISARSSNARLQQTTDVSVQEASISVIRGGPTAIGIPPFNPVFHLEILIVISPDVWFLIKTPGMPHNPQNYPLIVALLSKRVLSRS